MSTKTESYQQRERRFGKTSEQVAEENGGAFDIVKIDVDEAEDLSREFGIMSIPTLMVFKDGKLVKRESGLRPKNAIFDMMSDI